MDKVFSIKTDKSHYEEGETILITGEVTQILEKYPLSLTVIAPNGNIVSIEQLTVGADKKFSTSLVAGGKLMKNQGTHIVKVQYGDNKNNSATTTFEFDTSPV